MRKRWIASIALSLGFLATSAQAGNDPWQLPAPAPTTAAAKIGRPIMVDDATPPPLPPMVDAQVRPTAYDTVPTYITDPSIPKPLPAGPPSSTNMHTFVKPDDSTGAPPLASSTGIGKPVADDGGTLSAPRPVDSSTGYTVPLWTRFGGAFGADCGGAGDCDGNGCLAGACNDGCYNTGNRWYVSTEALVWWMKGNKVPPLVTTGSAADAVPGALGQPGTRVLFGNNDLASSADAGGRIMAGYWFTDDHCFGIEGGFWALSPKTNNFSASSLGDPLLFRPFTDETGAQNVELVAVPSSTGSPALAGTVSVMSKTSLWGTEANLRSRLCCGPTWYVDGLLGFRVMGLDDDLEIHESLEALHDLPGLPSRAGAGVIPAGTTFQVDDRFRTFNRFYGGQVGLDMECREGNWIFGLKTKLAIGATNEAVNIAGSTVIAVPGQTANTYNGGLLAQPSNIGAYSRNVFSVVPEANMSVGYQWNEHWRTFIAYDVIYWSNVVRSGNQIDMRVDRNQIPPPAATGSVPAFSFHNSDFWAQGITLGVEYKW